MGSPDIEQGIARLKGFLDQPGEHGEDIHELYSELLEMCAGDQDRLREVRQLGGRIAELTEAGVLPRAFVRRGPTRE
ncbi:MAG: hypothetical protein KJO07_10265 [Deltaproteobacteria bacterium]|jgi:hypothetical protein|nr:hypothetical protein [Deltaproteobacteria bacterium]